MTMKTIFSVSALLFSAIIMGCNVTADEKSTHSNTPDHMSALAWAQSADAEVDAKKAIKQKDYRLFVVAGRGERLVGIDAKDAARLKQACGTQYIQGSTDAIRSDEHLDALKKAYSYAEQYNQIVAKHCTN